MHIKLSGPTMADLSRRRKHKRASGQGLIANDDRKPIHFYPMRKNARALTHRGMGRLQVCWQSMLQ
jgi:hypothetical protein